VKRFLRSNFARSALPPLAAGYLKVARTGLRMVRDDSPKAHAIIAAGNPVLACFWHNRLLVNVLCWRGPGIDMLISQSRDGQMIAETAKRFGYGYIVGSTAKGDRDRRSTGAARDVVSRLGNGRFVGITPDGPRGPRQRASAGAIRLAQMAGVDIVPVAASVSPSWRANSWDRMMVPYPRPFARGALLFGDRIIVPREADRIGREAVRMSLEQTLNALTEEADSLVGVPVIEPADPPGAAARRARVASA
jgi:lysophospholipid acyltransferase (LPLAT)-like uncharacterized protein